MRAFEYASPKTKEQAIALLSPGQRSAALAGGTDLLALMKDDVEQPARVVDLKQIDGLRKISEATGGATIGALTTMGELADHALILKNYPALSRALDDAASPQIRNRATIGGNLCQRPRCWYFRNGFGLLPQDEMKRDLVEQGDNRYHAILGNEGPARFVSPSTIVPVLIAYRARVRICGPAGTRELALADFYRIPQTQDQREHNLSADEIMTEIFLPSASDWSVAQYEVRQKTAFDWPLALAAVALRMKGKIVQEARAVLGAVAPIPWISTETEQILVGHPISEAAANAAAEAALQKARPLSRNAYKVQLARVAVKRAILQAGELS